MIFARMRSGVNLVLTRICIIFILTTVSGCGGESVREFEVPENVAVGALIGHIGASSGKEPSVGKEQSTVSQRAPPMPPYLIVPVPGSAVDSDLDIDQSTGEIRTKIVLDRETKSYYSFVAIPSSGENIRVVANVLDENDNAPEFPHLFMEIEFPENSPRDSKRTLSPARDKDMGVNNVQQYKIVAGNANNSFRLSSHRERDDVLYLDLQVNGFLDREATPFYSLVIDAYDGGTPPLKGAMTVNITILDVNDNQPLFNQSRYSAQIAENATIGTGVLGVAATDADAGENGDVRYAINRRQSDRENYFAIDPKTGVISVNGALDFETKDVHELVVVARDNGAQPLETTAFVTVQVVDVNDNQPTISLIFLRDDASPRIAEDAQPGEFVARISVNDPDSKTEYSNANVTLEGGDGHFGLTTRDNIIYLVFVNKPLDRELQSNYTLIVTATDQGNPPLQVSATFDLVITDVNDNAPEFEQTVYYTSVLEVADPGTSVLQLMAVDRDEGNNSMISYSILDSPDTHAQWFQINTKTGLVTTRSHVDCETNPAPKITVVATDHGQPPMSTSATVTITILDVNDNEPIFDQSFYNVSVMENEAVGKCILKVSASDADCGVNGKVNYTLGDTTMKTAEFFMNPVSGELCIRGQLDHEKRSIYEFPVVATDRGSLSTTAMAKIQVIDVNDNRPIFYPREYNVSLKEQVAITTPVIAVVATDADSDKYGSVTYKIVTGNHQELFHIDSGTGEIFLKHPLSKGSPMHHLTVSAVDGGGLSSAANAQVWVSAIDPNQQPPIFDQSRYSFAISEQSKVGATVGTVRAIGATGSHKEDVRYSISSGDPDGYFSIDPSSGEITTNIGLDHEAHSSLLLNVQALSGNPPSYGHTQVNVTIKDANDNAPIFDSPEVKISVPENVELGSAIYAAHATDPDEANNGAVTYVLLRNPKETFQIGLYTGYLTLRHPLDYENQQRYSLIVGAADGGLPSLHSNMTLTVEVQDVNDNPPVFEKQEYSVSVEESYTINMQFLQVVATDKDTGNNARLTYIIKDERNASIFGIFPNSGSLYLKEKLDRESKDGYVITVIARDNGSPPLSATCTVKISVLDVNDNDPKFSHRSYSFFVWENMENGISVGTVSATDQDLGNNSSLRYSLVPNNTLFQIDAITGVIIVKMSLDREQKDVYDIVAHVHDNGIPRRYHSAAVTIRIGDLNDNSPTFIEPKVDVVGIREEQPIGTEVIQVLAIDNDEGMNGTVMYSLIKEGDALDADAFEINTDTGMISTAAALDHEQKSIYRVAVLAKDHGQPSLQEVRILRIEVLDLNDNRPAFSSMSITLEVLENVPLGTNIGTVNAVDVDGGDNGRISYGIIGGNRLHAFQINRTTGALYVVRPVDYEQSSTHVLLVKAVDNSALNPMGSVVNVTIKIKDVNDNTPTFEQDPIVFKVSERAVLESVVWNFTAEDRDSGPNGEVRYAIKKISPIPIPFELDPVTGALKLKELLDYESCKEYTFVVVASDSANASKRLASSATVHLLVEDENDNAPGFVSRTSVSVPEDEPVGFAVMNVIAVDLDTGNNGRISYGILSGNAERRFELNSTTGLLNLAKLLDRETTSKYILNISASDNGHPTLTSYQSIEILVEDVNDNNPTFEHPIYVANMSENSPAETFIITVLATDEDIGVNANLTYLLPDGALGNKFAIDPVKGEIRTLIPLDREEYDTYVVTVYVRDGAFPALYDTATVIIGLTDVNDNPPVFHDSCYPLFVPENSDLAVIHSVLAEDVDSGPNGDVTYSLTSGNSANKFSIDLHTGQLTAAPLDREVAVSYQLTITARDNGDSPRTATCNITITVEDQNDNDPRFSQDVYTLTIPEDIPANTTVLVLTATDADAGDNALITYSLSNETQWLFKIDSHTGAVTTAGMFDREKRAVYSFEVRATDGGKYDARSERTLVQVTIGDVNDNKPIFGKYPYTVDVPGNVQAGSQIIQIAAQDKDEGPNAEIVYSFANADLADKFHISPESGIVTAVGNLKTDSSETYHLIILAQDKGKPAHTSTGMIQIQVGETTDATSLAFYNLTYSVQIPENLPTGRDVALVSAARSDGKKVGITYSFSSGNEEGTFDIAPATGFIQIKDPRRLDYELSPRVRLIVAAQSDGPYPLYGYATMWVNLIDQNDNPPRFTQDHYVSAVWEGNNKGTFVMQVSATDDDQGQNGNIVYHIVDGNYDNAFVIEPPFSGIVKTNIVLDREIREFYRLTIIAMDEGTPQLTGTCTLRINIIDVNDNQPTFPPQNIVSVSEASKIGMAVTTITANDVDTNPALTYDFASGGNPGGLFNIDRYSGKITLSKPLDHEESPRHVLRIQASDTAHVVDTTLTVNVIDENDNAPMFGQQFYQVTVKTSSEPTTNIITINATDSDSGDNGRIKYSLKNNGIEGFYINEQSGNIFTNKTANFDKQKQTVQLLVIAEDQGIYSQSSSAAVRIQFADSSLNKPQFPQPVYTTRIGEDTPKGSVVLKLGLATSSRKYMYSISDAKVGRYFDIDNRNGDIILIKDIDRESAKTYNLVVTASDRGTTTRNATAEVVIHAEDSNDNPPFFNKSTFAVNVSESAAVGHSIFQVAALDPDEGENSKVTFDITSGNKGEVFEINRQSGMLVLKKSLDYENEKEYRLVARATDASAKNRMSSITTVLIRVQDENDNEPFFPLPSYLEFIAENAPIGSLVAYMNAYDADAGVYGKLNYSIADKAGREKFRIDAETGSITSNKVFDYELENQHLLMVSAEDSGGKKATIRIQIDVESRDEFAPVFLDNYHFIVPGNAKVGYVVGKVEARDKDMGPDGRIVYQLRSSHPSFKINRTSGEIVVKSPFRAEQGLQRHRRRREAGGKDGVSLVVSASSGRPNSLTNITVVEITVDFLNGTALAAGPHDGAGGLAGWTLGLVIALAILAVALFSVIVFLRLRNRRMGKSGMAQEFDSSFDTIDIRSAPTSSQYPPGYDDIAHYGTAEGPPHPHHHHRGNTTSEISDQSNSASSGRGSAEEGEDVEDEEIRMINEGPLMQQKMRNRMVMPDSGIQEDNEDNISESSVHNTQEYLARLGINTARSEGKKSPQDFEKILGGHSIESMHMFDDEGGGESDGVDITNLIYAKLNEVGTEENDAILDGTRTYGFSDESQLSMTGSLSSIVHSEEELTGSYNWDYLLDWGPQYQPLAHVFAEIARLKDDTVQHGQTVPKKPLNPQVKALLPPPLITNVAPRSIAPVALSSTRTSQVASLPSLPRSPIGHESTFMSSAMSPSFSPALSPLATRSPSISPLVAPGSATLSISNHSSGASRNQRPSMLCNNPIPESDNELRI